MVNTLITQRTRRRRPERLLPGEELSDVRCSRGRRADLVVLDRDITKVPVKEIRATKVQYTVVSGRVVHEAGSETGRARAEDAQRMGALGAGRASGGSCCRGHLPAHRVRVIGA
ncbi:amidohydrolase family protein [Streptomyces europaeiscabiei]|uniref:amidohydrolase family protein n=1 Tax=Streptomyces europaeiscabiei TaxID=146819 RepID=UPI002E2CED07|nr:amidohydrolase family protein [Streptomyces europaeiscabiei]